MHENMLDIKSMIRLKDERENAERYGLKFQPPRRPPKTKQEIDYEYELAQKAKYKIKKLENGQPDPNDKTLLFESKFESGNLYLAQKVSDSEYNLLMQNDINTNGHTQWFYF